MECAKDDVWGHLGSRDMTTFVKSDGVEEDARITTIFEKVVKHHIEWCSQHTKRMDFGARYDNTMILRPHNIRMQLYLDVATL